MISLSIIIPIYNVERYIERCLISLENQDIPERDYEIICINDGSPDNSDKIVTKLQRKYKNIKLISQENQGVSKSRNNGMDCATGKFLLMVDPDDYVQPNTFSGILKYALAYKADVTFLGFCFLNQDGTLRHEILNESNKDRIYTGIEASKLSRGDGKVDPDRMWGVLYDREFIENHKLRFTENVPFLEDGELIAKILTLSNRCIFYGAPFYLRTSRPDSATSSNLSKTSKATYGFVKSAKSIADFRNMHHFNCEQIGYLNSKLIKFITLSIASVATPSQVFRYGELRRILRDSNLGVIDLEGVNGKYLVYGNILKKSIFHLFIYVLYEKAITKFKQILGR